MVCLDTIIISVAFVLVSFGIDSAHNVPIIHQYTQSFNSKLDPVSETIGSELPSLPHQRRLVASLIPAGDLTPPTDPTRPHHKVPTLATARNNEKNGPVRGKPLSSQHPKRHDDGGKHAANSSSKMAKLTDRGDAKRNTDAVRNTTKPVIGNAENSFKKTDKLFSGTRTGKELVNTPLKLLPSSPKPRENAPLNPNEGILHLSHKFAELFPNGLLAALNAQSGGGDGGGVRSSLHPLRLTPGQVVQKIPNDKSSSEEGDSEDVVVSNVQKIERKPTDDDSDETVIEVYRIEDDVERTNKDVARILDELNRSLNLEEIIAGGNKVKVMPKDAGLKTSGVHLNAGQTGLDEFLANKRLIVPLGDDGGDLQERMSNDMMVEKIEEEMMELDENMKSNETESDSKDEVEDEDTESIMHKLRHTDVFAIIYLGGFIGLVTFFFILACSEIFCQNCLYRSSSNLFLPQAHCTHSYYSTPKPVTPPPPYHLFAPPPYMDIAKAFTNVNQSGKTVSHTILHIEATVKASANNGAPCACPGTPCPPYSREQTGVPQGSHISPLVSIINMEDHPCPPYQGTPVSHHKTTNNVSENERDKTCFQQYETTKPPGEAMYEVHRIPSKPILCPCKYDGTTDTIIKSSPNTGDHTVRHCVSFSECNDNRQVNTYTFKNSVSFSEQTGLTSSTESKMNEIDNRLALSNFLRENLQFKNQLKTRIRNSLSFTSNHSVEMEDPGVKHSVSYAEHMDNACRTPDELADRGHLGKQHCRSCFAISSLHSSIPEFGSMSVDKPLVDFSNVHSHKSHQRTEKGVDISNQNYVDIRNQNNTVNKEPVTGNLLNTSLMTPDKDTRTTVQTNIRRDDSNLYKQKTNLDTNITRESSAVSTNTCQGFVNQMDSLSEPTNTFVNQMEPERKVDCMNSNKTEKPTDFIVESKDNDFISSNRVTETIETTSLLDHNTSIDTLTLTMNSTQSTERPLENYNTPVHTLGTERILIDRNTSIDDTHVKDSQISQSQNSHMNSYNSVDNTKELNNSQMTSAGAGHCALTSDKDCRNSPGTSRGKIEDKPNATAGISMGKTEDRGNSIGITDTENKGSAQGKNLKTKIFFIDDLDDEIFS
uniref:Uncharacterized protein n=1 Tax=Cacopsylla melanoneura TaxID=428564 RepID=A0A8D8YM18_9HEMI